MLSFNSAAALLVALAATAFGTALHEIEKFNGDVSGRLIVKFKDSTARASAADKLGSSVTHEWDTLNGVAGHFTPEHLAMLRQSPDVESISEDGFMHTMVSQTNAPWGIARISQTARLSNQDFNALTFNYTYDASAGAGVDIFIVDTGVLTTHTQFGGRAKWGATFGGYASADGNGHGTHCAGTAAGSQFGVAKAASIIAVKVLDDEGSGAVSDILSGINFVITTARSTGRPSIISMSLGGSASTALDNAVASATSAGIHVTVAAGNSNTDAETSSPARAPSAVTVGATTIGDARASFSNFGAVVDVFAPGQSITSAWIGSTSATNQISGTSMATPHVAGLIAYLIGLNGQSTPAAMSTTLKSLSLKSFITNIPSGTLNDFVHNS